MRRCLSPTSGSSLKQAHKAICHFGLGNGTCDLAHAKQALLSHIWSPSSRQHLPYPDNIMVLREGSWSWFLFGDRISLCTSACPALGLDACTHVQLIGYEDRVLDYLGLSSASLSCGCLPRLLFASGPVVFRPLFCGS